MEAKFDPSKHGLDAVLLKYSVNFWGEIRLWVFWLRVRNFEVRAWVTLIYFCRYHWITVTSNERLKSSKQSPITLYWLDGSRPRGRALIGGVDVMIMASPQGVYIWSDQGRVYSEIVWVCRVGRILLLHWVCFTRIEDDGKLLMLSCSNSMLLL